MGTRLHRQSQIQVWMKQTMDWIGGIAAQNKFSGAWFTLDDAKGSAHKKRVTNGPFGEIKERLAGYIIVKANSVDDAVEFCQGVSGATGSRQSP